MKQLFVIIIFGFSHYFLRAQSCTDTITVNKFVNNSFTRSSLKFGRICPTPDSGFFLGVNGVLMKFDNRQELLCTKKIPNLYGSLSATSDGGVICAFSLTTDSGFIGNCKISADGQMIWARVSEEVSDLASISSGGDHIRGGRSNFPFSGIRLMVSDSNFTTITTNKAYRYQLGQFNEHGPITSCVKGESLYILSRSATQFSQGPNANSKYVAHLLKVNYKTAAIENAISFKLNDTLISPQTFGDTSFVVGLFYTPRLTMQIANDNSVIIAGETSFGSTGFNRFLALTIDSSFQSIKSRYFSYPDSFQRSASFSNVKVYPAIKADKTILFSKIFFDGNILDPNISKGFIYSFTVNEAFQVTKQNKISLLNLGYNFASAIAKRIVPYLSPIDGGGMFLYNDIERDNVLVHFPFHNSIEDICVASNTDLITVSDPKAILVSPSVFVTLEPGIPYSINNYPLSLEDDVVGKEIICEKIISCDFLKISTNTPICADNMPINFLVKRNEGCNRKIILNYDSSAMSAVKVSDSTYIFRFRSSFNGYIYASLAGCSVRDSIFISAAQPAQKPFIGADTILCVNDKLTLKAGKGYKNYIWNNGSTNDSLIINSGGLYSVQVTDSCGIIFSDTISIKQVSNMFKPLLPTNICLHDTAYLTIPEGLSLSWQPIQAALQKNNQLKIFPSRSTDFLLSSTTTDGCETVTSSNIIVEICATNFHIPNAFSPNGDGVNDFFKPIIEGNTVFYTFEIFDRYGTSVFRSTEQGKGWSGKNQGQPASAGNYIWICTYQFRREKVVHTKGNVLLLR